MIYKIYTKYFTLFFNCSTHYILKHTSFEISLFFLEDMTSKFIKADIEDLANETVDYFSVNIFFQFSFFIVQLQLSHILPHCSPIINVP